MPPLHTPFDPPADKPQSDTPRTDALWGEYRAMASWSKCTEFIELARQLERELLMAQFKLGMAESAPDLMAKLKPFEDGERNTRSAGVCRDAERYRLFRANVGREIVASSNTAPGMPHTLRINFDATGCERYTADGAVDFPATIDAILDDEARIRASWERK